ncbi:hypothetical protein M513_07165 [Trichuris suis]|uniref:Uncharacterized protein n=1 Tax=Trichuris suis TaxID=68888 RepID=A0A085M487_9BILA|nr:hypothetical protein M513_07165 [Trichuris suis]
MYNTLTVPPDGQHNLSFVEFGLRSRDTTSRHCDDLAEERATLDHGLTVSSEKRTCGRNAPNFVISTQLMWHP